GVVAFAIALDLVLYVLLKNAISLDQSSVRQFAAVNISLLAGSFLVTVALMRRPHRLYRALALSCLTAEALSMMIWIQMTGSVTSYFLIMAILMVLLYRLAWDYWMGLACLLLVSGFHLAAFALEEAHLLRPARLFVEDPGAIYSSTVYRYGALSSIVWCYA